MPETKPALEEEEQPEHLETLAVDAITGALEPETAEEAELELDPVDMGSVGELTPRLMDSLEFDQEEELLLDESSEDWNSVSALLSLEEASVSEMGPRASIEASLKGGPTPSVSDVMPSSYSLDPDLDALVIEQKSQSESTEPQPSDQDPDEEPTMDGAGPKIENEQLPCPGRPGAWRAAG